MTEHSWFISHLWLVPLLPFLGFLIQALALRSFKPNVSSTVAILAMIGATIVGWGAAIEYFGHAHGQTLVPLSYPWLRFTDKLVGNMGLLVDDISMLLVVVVTTISTLIHIYSTGYMHGDKGYRRFFACLNLFSFSMLGLVLAVSVLQIFIFWELVGVSSFLLIGFYWEKPSAVAACKKAFIVTRFADLGFLLGLLLLSYYAGRLDFLDLTRKETLDLLANTKLPILGVSLLPLSAILVFCGAAGKSAMFPLHIWLPDAMEGPTPVSALIHAATMVVAGVYLVARLFPMYAASSAAISVVMVIGAFTSLFAAVIATTQFDIKRVLAFSTLSQLGYMMLALGVATMDHPLGFTASMFHLTTHACFKALLFLGAGSVIHAVHSNDMRDMGGLRKKLPWTHGTFAIACLAIAGVPPLSGFFSKDEILAAAWGNGHYLVFATAMFVAGLTAFYMFRLYFMTFWSTPADHHRYEHAHESPWSMLFPLVALAVPSVLAGFIPFGHYVNRGDLGHHGINWAIAIPATLMGLGGIGFAWFLYFRPNEVPNRFEHAFGVFHKVTFNKFYVDEVYQFVTHKIIFRFISAPFNWFDRKCVDGAMDLSAQASRLGGHWLRQTVTGHLQTYFLWVIGGALLLALVLWKSETWLLAAVAGLGLVAVGVVFVWQLVLVMAKKTEPLKRIDRD
ncbi:MAG: NADH-quinone oxidoreductase subunit L [Verrucomicrobia bacterium]|nr:NADH-quinone oxidoreductase subunit L [Verrucomicrobiota bacterium]